MRVVIFGAGGRAGRQIVAEARSRGHEVTAVVRDPAAHPDLPTVPGDVTDPTSVATLAAAHDVAVNAAARLNDAAFYPQATAALLEGLDKAGVPRLIALGIGSMLEPVPGHPLYLNPDFPADAREFTLGHVAELEALRASKTSLDWLVLAPPPTMLDATATRTGNYQLGTTAVLPASPDAPLFAYADLAVAVVDEIEQPRRHRELVAVGPPG